MGPSPTYRPPEGEGTETSFEHGLALWARLAAGCCSRQRRTSPTRRSRLPEAGALGPSKVSISPMGGSLWGQPKYREYLRTYLHPASLVTS